jgi:hypothetical protein
MKSMVLSVMCSSMNGRISRSALKLKVFCSDGIPSAEYPLRAPCAIALCSLLDKIRTRHQGFLRYWRLGICPIHTAADRGAMTPLGCGMRFESYWGHRRIRDSHLGAIGARLRPGPPSRRLTSARRLLATLGRPSGYGTDLLRSGKVEAIEIHDLVPRSHEVAHELFL